MAVGGSMKKIVKIAAVILMAVCSIRFVQCYGLSSKSAVDLDDYSTPKAYEGERNDKAD